MSDYIYKAFFAVIITVYIRFVNICIINTFYNISSISLSGASAALLLIFKQCLNKLRTTARIALKKEEELKNNKIKAFSNYKPGLKKKKNKKNNKSNNKTAFNNKTSKNQIIINIFNIFILILKN